MGVEGYRGTGRKTEAVVDAAAGSGNATGGQAASHRRGMAPRL